MTASFFDPAALRTRLREQPSPDVPFLVVLLASRGMAGTDHVDGAHAKDAQEMQ